MSNLKINQIDTFFASAAQIAPDVAAAVNPAHENHPASGSPPDDDDPPPSAPGAAARSTLRTLLDARPRLQSEWKALAGPSAFHEAHLRASIDKVQRLAAVGAYEGRASNDNTPRVGGPALAPTPDRKFYLLTVASDGAVDSELVRAALVRLINAALREAGLTPWRRIFTPAGGPAHILFEQGGPEDRVAERAVKAIRTFADTVADADAKAKAATEAEAARSLSDRRPVVRLLGPVSASVVFGEATVGAWTDGPVFARGRALTGVGPCPTLRLDPEVYHHVHRNGPMARGLLAVFSAVAVGEGVGAPAYETVVGPRRPASLKPSRARVRFLGGRFDPTHSLPRRR